jgi:hypothetical protein
MQKIILLLILIKSWSLCASDIIYLGDSLSANDSFGRKMYEMIVQKYDLQFEALCGSSPFWWTKGSVQTKCGYNVNMEWKKSGGSSNLKTLIEQESPKYIIIQQGTNLLTGQLSSSSIKTQILTMLNTIPKEIECIWIGPPDADDNKISDKKFSNFYSILNDLTKDRCTLIDSWGKEKTTHYPKNLGDGIHFSGKVQDAEEAKWFKHVKNQIDLHLH